jgi:hypothetical protein
LIPAVPILLEINELGEKLGRAHEAGMADAKNNNMMHKVSLLPTMMVILVAAVAAKVRAMIDAQMPMGYQDEGGFHAGIKRDGDAKWPSLW